MSRTSSVRTGLVLTALLVISTLTADAAAGEVKICVSAREFGRGIANVYLMDRDGTDVICVTAHLEGDKIRARVSPDGTRLAFHRYWPDGWNSEWDAIQVMDLETGEVTHTLTESGKVYRLGDWMDDDTLIYSEFHGGVHVLDLDGTDTLVEGGPGWAYRPRVSRDGTRILCGFARPYNAYSTDLHVHTLGVPGWRPLVTDPGRDSHGVWGREPDFVYYQHEERVPSVDRILGTRDPGGALWRVRDEQSDVCLYDAAPDRNEILFAVNSVTTTLWVRDLDTGVETPIFVTQGRNLDVGAYYYEIPDPVEDDPVTVGSLEVGLGFLLLGLYRRRRRLPRSPRAMRRQEGAA